MPTIDPNLIDETKPAQGEASTANVRANEAATKTNFERAVNDITPLEEHVADTSTNPHNVTAAQTGAAPSSHVGAGGGEHPNATTIVSGFMSGPDKTKLDGVEDGANAYSHPDHTGEVTSSGDGAQTITAGAVTTAKLADNAVTNVKAADMAQNAIKLRNSPGTGDPEDVSVLGLQVGGTPAAGDVVLGQKSGGDLVSFLTDDLGGGGGGGTVRDIYEGAALALAGAVEMEFTASGDASVDLTDLGGNRVRINYDATAGSGGGGIGAGTPFVVGELMEVFSAAGDGTAVSSGLTAATITGHIGDTTTNPHQVDHSQTNPDGDEHVDHSAVSITAGDGLTGGGNITQTRTIDVDATVQRRISGGTNGNLVSRDASGDVQDSGVSASDFGEVNDGANVGVGTGQVYRDKAGTDINLRTLSSGDGSVSFTTLANEINGQVVPGNVDHDQLLNYSAAEHFTEASITHNNVGSRDSSDAHPIAAVTGLQAALDSKLENVAEDTSPQLGGELQTEGNLIAIRTSGGAYQGLIGDISPGPGAFLAYSPDGLTFDPADGALTVEPGQVHTYGNQIAEGLKHSDSAGRQVYVSQGGVYYSVEAPEPGWEDTAIDTTNTARAGAVGAWQRLTNLDCTIAQDLSADRLNIEASVWTVNGTSNRTGTVEIGYGIGVAQPTAGAATFIPESFAGYVQLSVSPSLTETAGTDIGFWMRVTNESNPAFSTNLTFDGSAGNAHASRIATPGAPGGGGTGDVVQGSTSGGAAPNDRALGVWQDEAGKLLKSIQIAEFPINNVPDEDFSSFLFQTGTDAPIERVAPNFLVRSVPEVLLSDISAVIANNVGYIGTLATLAPGAAEVPEPATGQYRQLSGGTSAVTPAAMTSTGHVAWTFDVSSYTIDTSNYQVIGSPPASGNATIVFSNYGVGPQIAAWQYEAP